MSDEVTLIGQGSVDVHLTFDDQSNLSIVLPLNYSVSIDLTFGGSVMDAGGGGSTVFQAIAFETLQAGFPIAISRANGKIIKAVASYKPSAFVAGMLVIDVIAGFEGTFSADRITITDWTAITGSVNLLPGRSYFLGNSGGLDLNPPGSGSCLVLVGTAIDTTTLLVDIQPPIEI